MDGPAIELHTVSGEVFDANEPDAPLAYPLDFPPTISALLRRAVDRYATLPFLVTRDGSYTFADIDRRSAALARHLVARGVGKGSRVGMLFPQGPEWVVAFLGAARAGALVMAFSTFYTPHELARSLRHGDVQHLIVPAQMFGRDMADFVAEAVPGLLEAPSDRAFLAEMPYLRSLTVLDEFEAAESSEQVSDEFLAAVESEITPSDLLLTVYTSGTTSTPKGVVHTHGSQVRHGANLARIRSFSTESRIFSHMPFFWVGGFTCTLIPSLYTGAVLLTMDKFDPAGALDLIEREQATHLSAWPNVRVRMIEHPSYAGRDFSAIPFLPSPGDPEIDPGLLHNSLGMTETSGPHTAAGPDEFGVLLPEKYRGSFGRRVPHVQHRIVHHGTNQPVADGEEGEVCIRGYTVMAGMYKREREEVFDADGWYHTGDRAHFRDGLLFFGGRYGEMIKTAGANVAPIEVEVQMALLPGVESALVFGLPDRERGEVVVAAVVPEPGCELDPEALKARLGAEVSTYKVPREILVINHDDVPMLDNGKPDRRAVKTLLVDTLG